jgi:hypothetical protein
MAIFKTKKRTNSARIHRWISKNGINVRHPLKTQETLMKYIGGLPAHIRNIVFMFGPTNLDEVSVQAKYIEAGKAGVLGESSSSRKEDKRKRHGKNENAVTRKEGKPSCKH